MKNFLLFNQSFGTVGSPNQTGKTLAPRDNRAMTERRPSDEQRSRIPLLYPCYTFARAWKYVACMLMLLVLSIGQMWGETVLKTIDFSDAEWAGTTFSQGNTDTYDVHNGVTFHSKNASNHFSYSSNKLTFPGSNPSTSNYFLAFPIENIVDGRIIIRAYNGTSQAMVQYAVSDGRTEFSSSAPSFTTTIQGAPTAVCVTGLSNANKKAYVYIGRGSSSYTEITKIEVLTGGTTLTESAFYQTYGTSNKTAYEFMALAEFPSYLIPTNAGSINTQSNSGITVPEISSPHNFAGLSTSTTYYRIKNANNNTYTLYNVANLKSVRFYGNGDGGTPTITTTVTKVSGSGSSFSVSTISTPTNNSKLIGEHTTGDLTSKSGYNADTYYDYTFKFTANFDLWGIYVEAGAASCTAPTSPNITGTTTYTAGGTISLTASATGTSGTTTYQWYKGDPDDGGTSQGAASTGGATFSKASCEVADGGTYYCVISNGTGCTAKVSQTVTVKPSVAIAPTNAYGWRYSIGETIDLTATPGGASSYTYQWQKYTEASGWIDVSDGVSATDGGTFSGTATARLQISNCTSKNGGSYRCQVTGGGETNESDAERVYVFTVNGNYYNTGWVENAIVWESEYVGTATISLEESRTYEFKVYNNDGKVFGYSSGNYIIQPWSNDCGTENSNIRLFTGPAGNYTVTVNIQHSTDNYVNVAVAYPSVTHPAEGYIYVTKWSWDLYAHFWDDKGVALTANGSDPKITTYTEICDNNYWYFPKLDNYVWLKIKDNTDTDAATNKSSDQTTTSHSAMLLTHTSDWVWQEVGYTVSFNANGGTGTMDDIEHICSGSNQTLPDNTFTRTGWEFTGWNTSKYGNGTPYAAGATIEGITGDITLYAQWEKTVYMQATGDLNWWYNDDAWFAIYYWDNSANTNNGYVNMELVDCETNVYKATLPGNGYDKLLFLRMNPTNYPIASTTTGKWNQTSNISYPTSNPKFTINGGSDQACTGDWGAYTPPAQYTITFAANGGGSSMSAIEEICTGTDQALTANAFTAPTGCASFAHWTANVNVTVGDATVIAGNAIADGATIQNISSNITLTAVWKLATPTITDGGDNTFTISGSMDGSSYKYSIDGSAPSLTYSSAVDFSAGEADITAKAIAHKTGYVDSDVASQACTYHAAATCTGDPTALEANTVYQAAAMLSNCAAAISGTGQQIYGLSSNGKFYIVGTTNDNDGSTGTVEIKNETNDDIGGDTDADFSSVAYLKMAGSQSHHSIKFVVPSAGTLTVWGYTKKGESNGDVQIKPQDGDAVTLITHDKDNNIKASASTSVTAGTYYLLSNGGGAAVYGIKFVAAVACTAAPTVTAGSNSSVGSTTATVSCASGISSLGTGGCTISSYGFVIGTVTDPTIGGSGVTQHEVGTSYASTGTPFSKDLTGLTAETTYYVRPYATNGFGTAYGTQTSFTTEAAAATYTVTYNAQGGSVTPSSETVSTATLPTPTKSGYTFDGWYTSGGSKITGTYNPTADITLYAQWQEICAGSGEKDTIKIGVSSSTSYAASFTSSHKSTHTTASATAFTTGGSTTTSNSTYDKATAPYSVKFKPSSNINTDVWSDNYSVSASFSVASGYTFTPTRISATIVTEAADYTYRALLTDGETTYTSSDVSSSANGKFTFSFSSLSGTALSGTITFKVQYKSTANNAKFFVFNLPIEIDGIVTASGGGGGASCYYVTYNGNGATGGYTTDEAAYASGDEATAATNSFTKTGYTFGGWATSKANADAGTKAYDEGDAIAISGDITLYAIWQAAGYTLAWNTNGGSALDGDYSSGSFADGVAITAPTDPTLSNYTFNSWNTEGDGTGNAYTGTMPAANTTYYAVWGQAVTLDANTENHGSLAGSATAILGRAGLTGITHATPASGYKLTGYYTDATEGTKVLNSDGTFASSNVTDYITSGKWSRTGAAPTLYAQYEASGSLKWNLGVKTDAESLTTSSKESSFTEISTSTMGNATVYGVTYTASSKNNLTGQISTPAEYDANKYVYVTFTVADGYKFTPSSISVKVQPVGENEHKAVELSLADATNTLVSGSATKCDGTSSGTTTTVTLAGDGTYFTGTVTLKIYVYAHATASATTNNCYRLGTPIEIQGEIETLCATMPSFTGLDYIQSSYTVGEDASAISIEGGENINTYAWKQNTTNDRSGTTPASGTNDEASYTPPTGAAGTMYYWCEMTNTACDITIKSPAVAITVRADKSDASVTWTDPANEPNYGGGGYVIRATMNSGYDGTLSTEDLTAPAGIRITNVSIDNEAAQKYIEATFDVTTAFDRDENSVIAFTLSHDATTGYDAISDEHEVDYNACSGGGGGSSYNIRVRKSYDKDASNNYRWVTPGAGEITYAVGSSISSGKAGTAMATYFDSIMSSDKQYIWVKTFVDNIKQMRLYVETSGANVSVSALYQRTTYAAADAKDVITGYSVVYDEDDDAENTGTKGQHTIDLIFTSALSANDIICVKFSSSKVKALGAAITEGSGGSLNTHLQWSGDLEDDATVAKYTTDAYFTYSASMITENTNSLGAITYSSSDPSVATVDATGKVAMVAAGTTTIKATLAASGCYKKAEISYTLNVTEVPCEIAAGTLTLTSGTESKCSGDNVTLTLTGFESGASIQWKDGDTNINNGGNYTIATDGTTSTLTTNQEGTYSVMVTSGCSVRSNRITISNKSTSVHVTRLVKEWYIKNGRLTPDIALWELGDDCSFVSVAASDGWDAGTDLTEEGIFYEKDGIVYLKGTEPKANAGAVHDYTLTLTVNDGCDDVEQTASGKLITIHHQQNTDKHVLAFVVSGEDKGDWTAGVTADQTTNVGLYNAIAANFDVLATNSRSTDDEQKLKEYYSQFDILCITDYPNTGDKGSNKKSYVDAIGSLIDIRPILTMEAWVSKLANWKAKGISGNPKSPSTRQYTMDLQCKDHEIFAGTKLTKVGEGDEAMYRVSMVDNTKEDYATLDATYGDGAHADKSGYEYASKPALQGFTFTEEMANDLLPIGLIDDGAGNPLQVGIERQHNMEARLMVLGINSYAMERLTDDGEQVVINALNYLMKKNQEDIADCSTAFVGGAEGEEKNWNNADNWTGNTVPLPSQKVRILADCEVSSTVYAQSVLIVTDGKYNHGSDDAAGKLTIKENGALIVGGKIQAASAPAYNRTRATTPEKLIINTDEYNQAALIFDNEEAETQATVNLYSLGRKPSSYQYQYFAVPMEVVPVNPAFANETHDGTGIYTYVYDEASSGWERRKYYDDLFAFEGLGITTKSETAMNYTMTGNLASTATKEITLTHDGAGLNLIGNSWMAPIQIGALAEDNADLDNKTAYIYCAGRDAEGGAVVSSDDTETAGQWLAIPFEAAEFETWKAADKLSVIPAMQAFQIKVDAEATLTLDYDKVVRGSTNDLNAKLRAPGRRMAANEVTMTNIRVADSKTHTDLSLFEGDRFSEAFDNGWEAEYMNGDGRSAKLYAETEAGQMAVAAMYDYEGTIVGFEPGQETGYTFSFMGEDNGYYLNDIKLQNSVRISEGETYTFIYEEGDGANRFYISRTAINAPSVTTGMENLDAAAPRVQKIIYNDKLYIIRGGRLYDATGKVVK